MKGGSVAVFSGLRLHLLGGVRIVLDGVPIGVDLSQKGQALLCYLAVEHGVHPRPTLASLLWGEVSDADAATSLRQALAGLRRVLGPAITITRQTVALSAGAELWVDSAVFDVEAGAAQATSDIQRLQDAVELYRGDFLAGFGVRDAPGFDDWAAMERERLRVRAALALHRLARHAESAGDYAAAILPTTRLLQLDPWREEAHRQLMWLYVRSGQRSAALAQYQSCRRVLAEELGVEPMDETTALYERIRAASASRTGAVRVPTTPFVGRAAEVAALTRRLADPAFRLATITGPGGIGKTRLAIEVAAKVAPGFLHGAQVVPLAAVDSVEGLVFALAAVGRVPRGTGDPRGGLLTALADRDMLLVLDNFEQLVEGGAALLADVLQAAPEVRVLVTSRERLQLQDEWLIELQGLDVPPSADDEAYDTYGAVELFCRRARRIAPDFTFGPEEREAVVRICRLVEGLPLGIELAAAWVRVLSCAEVAEEIERGLEFLGTTAPDMPARHRNLHAVFDHSWRLLADGEREVLRRVAVFQGGFARDAAAQVANGSVSLLRALVDKSLVRKHAAVRGRYDMHELLRQYSLGQLERAGELDATRRRHLQFFFELAQTAEPELVGPEQAVWLDRLEREHENLRAALDWGLRPAATPDETETAARLGAALWRFWWLHGHLREGSRRLRAVLAQVWLPAAVRAAALHGRGVLLQEQGHFDDAGRCYEQSLALRRELGDTRGVAASLNSLGVVALDQDDYARARARFEESLVLKRELGDLKAIAGSLNNLGMVASAQGETAAARALYQESLEVFRRLGHQTGEAVALGNLAAITLDLGEPEADRLFRESIVLFQELGESDGVAECLEGLAGVAASDGQVERATRLCGAAAVLRAAIGAPLIPLERARYDRVLAAARAGLPEVEFAAAFAAGQALALEQAVAYALSGEDGDGEL